jgi:hypothetical protein
VTTTDIAALFGPATPGGGEQGAAQPVAFRKGTVAYWSTIDGANSITIDGQPFANLPILNRAEIPYIQEGDSVAVLVIGSGSTTMAVLGGIVPAG